MLYKEKPVCSYVKLVAQEIFNFAGASDDRDTRSRVLELGLDVRYTVSEDPRSISSRVYITNGRIESLAIHDYADAAVILAVLCPHSRSSIASTESVIRISELLIDAE